MDYPVIISPRAILDLEEIVRYVAQDNPSAAAKLGYALINRTKTLSTWPEMGRMTPEFNLPAIRELVLPPYRIVYRVNHSRKIIEVARFWHSARGTPRV